MAEDGPREGVPPAPLESGDALTAVEVTAGESGGASEAVPLQEPTEMAAEPEPDAPTAPVEAEPEPAPEPEADPNPALAPEQQEAGSELEPRWDQPAMGTLPVDSRFLRGISLRKLQELAERDECFGEHGEKRNVTEMWAYGDRAWARQTLPEGWKLEVIGKDHDWQNWRTGEYADIEPSARHSKLYKYVSPSGEEFFNRAPPGTTTMYHLAQRAEPDSVGRTTHMCSYPWAMPFVDIVQAVAHALKDWSDGEAFLFLDCLSDGSHDVIDLDPVEIEGHEKKVWLLEKQIAIKEMRGGVVQVCSKWDDPERRRRGWMMLESIFTVTAGAELVYAMCPDQEQCMVSELRRAGPEAILDIVEKVEVKRDKISCSRPGDTDRVFDKIEQIAACIDDGLRGLEELLANSTRKAYARAIERHFEEQWDQRSDLLSVEPDQSADLLDLGHQLAALWAMTDDQVKARHTFEKVLRALNILPETWKGGTVARRDRTAAALVQLILRMAPEEMKDAALKDAHSVEKKALGGELAVSFEGISVAFLIGFAEEHNAELNYLSTDAVVERVIKPSSKRLAVVGPSRKGRAFIETIHERWKGKPSFFLSHAWRQTFHVRHEDCSWRGGAVQALQDLAVCDTCVGVESKEDEDKRTCEACRLKRENTFVWFDIFCVNQHLKSPHGGLQAFAFEPLRNAIVEAREGLKMFLETWDDPATLSRVWCLEELRVAMLFGKQVQICMPSNAMRSFRKRAENEPDVLVKAIDMVVERISIEHASATFESDRRQVFGSINTSVGSKNMNKFCQVIMRKALMDAAFPNGLPADDQSFVRQQEARDRDETTKRGEIYEGMLEEADSFNTAQKIRIRRAVALMRLRENNEVSQALRELREVAILARRYYGTQAEETQDIVRQLSRTDSLRQ